MERRLVVRIQLTTGPDSVFELREELLIQTATIAETSNVLQLFHQLAERIRDEQAGMVRRPPCAGTASPRRFEPAPPASDKSEPGRG